MSSKDENLQNYSDLSLPKDYEILNEDCPNFDFSFKVIIIGNSGNLYLYYIKI